MAVKQEKIVMAMSGGVDSSVAAGLLLDAGYDVTGVFLCLGGPGGAFSGCCRPQDAADAAAVAKVLGIDFQVLNLAESFGPIIDYFAAEYAKGRTPNPCVHCNSLIKFGRLLDLADSLGARYVATGHHARIVEHAGAPFIARGRAKGKDQSYALFGIARERLGRILLPIGEVDDKAVVRHKARMLGLNVHDKPDSQDICFVADSDYSEVLRQRAPQAMKPGNIANSAGEVLGTHEGYGMFTIGQRRGLRVAAGVPMYVTKIDPASGTVTIGPKEEVMFDRLTASRGNWHAAVPQSFPATVQIRYNHSGAPATVRLTGPDTFEARFDAPVAAITPGQAAVVYDGERVLGGGWID